MADNTITFRIGSVFSGEGFSKAVEKVKETNMHFKKGIAAASQVSSALGNLDTSAAKAATAMTGVVEAFAQGGLTGGLVAASMALFNSYLQKSNEEMEALMKRANDLHASVEKAFGTIMADRIKAIRSEAAEIGSEFDRITKQANAFQSALNGVQSATMAGGIAALQVEKLNAMLEAHSDAERQTIEQTYNLKIAIQKSVDSETSWQMKIDAANQAMTDNRNKVANIDKQLSVIAEERRQLEETMNVAKASEDEHWIEIEKQVNALKDQEAALETKKLETLGQSDILELELQKVKQEAAAAQLTATAEVKNAELAEKLLTEAKLNREATEAAAKSAAELDAAAKEREALAIEDGVMTQQQLNDATKNLAEAEKMYQAKLYEYFESDIWSEAIRDHAKNGGKSETTSGLLPVDVRKSISTVVVDQKVDDAVRNGAVTTVKDADRMQREEMRKTRDQANKNSGQILQEQKKYERLKKLNPDALASSDKEFMKKYEKIVESAKSRKKALEDMKKNVDKQKDDIKKSRETIEKINKKLEKLGLK